jgi:hypothetical protein
MYQYLYKKENWRPHQFYALKLLYEAIEPCVPRKITFSGYSKSSSKHKLEFWIHIISKPIKGLKPVDGPTQEEKIALISKLPEHLRSLDPRYRDAPPVGITHALWGDSIHLRLFGSDYRADRFVSVDAKIDGADFRALLKQAHACRQRMEDALMSEKFIKAQYQMAQKEQEGYREAKSLDEENFRIRWLNIADWTETFK